MKDKYYPHKKEDFRKYYYNMEYGTLHTYEILRQLTDEEKIRCEFEYYEESEEMYEIELSDGEIYNRISIERIAPNL